MDFGANALNETMAQFQREVLQALQMETMVPANATQLIGKYPPA
jgi:hypothetical protein